MSLCKCGFNGPTFLHPDDMGMNMERKLSAEYPLVWVNPVPVPLCSATNITLL